MSITVREHISGMRDMGHDTSNRRPDSDAGSIRLRRCIRPSEDSSAVGCNNDIAGSRRTGSSGRDAINTRCCPCGRGAAGLCRTAHRACRPTLGRMTLLVLLVLLSAAVSDAGAGQGTLGREHQKLAWLLSAQCQARCMDVFKRGPRSQSEQVQERHQRHGEANADNLSVDASVEEFLRCENDHECLACLLPCFNETFQYDRCTNICEESRFAKSCQTSCAFLANSSQALLSDNAHPMATLLDDTQRCSQAEVPSPPHESSIVSPEVSPAPPEQPEPVTPSAQPEVMPDPCHADRPRCVQLVSLQTREVWETRGVVLTWRVQQRQQVGSSGAHPTRHHRHRAATMARHVRQDGGGGHVTKATTYGAPFVLHVVQMRQLIGGKPSTDWAVTTVTPDISCYVKHALTLGKTYVVRVLAVSASGLCYVSADSAPFGLPKEFPVPGPVRNLRYDEYDRERGGVLSYTVRWNTPNFTIAVAISNYLVTWEEEVADERQSHHATTPPGGVQPDVVRHLDERGGTFTSMRPVYLQEHVRIPGNRHSYSIQNLKPNSIYVIQIQAVAQLVEHQIYGETTSIKITTLSLSARGRNSSAVEGSRLPSSANVMVMNVTNVQIQNEFYKNGSLFVVLTWKYRDDLRHGIKGFAIQLHSEHCPTDLFDHSINSYNRSMYLTADNKDSSIELSNLLFDCTYWVGVKVLAAHITKNSQYNEKFVTFSTPSCLDVAVVGTGYPDCPRIAPHNFTCDTQFTLKATQVNCQWTYRGGTDIRGFLVVVKTPVTNQRHQKNATTIKYRLKNKDVRQIQLKDLVHNSKYYATIRAVGSEGLGPTAQVHFFVPVLPYQGDSHQAAFHATKATSGSFATMPAHGSGYALFYIVATLFIVTLLRP